MAEENPFPLAPLRFWLEIRAPFHVPEYKGALFRGGFGRFFRDLACVTQAAQCGGCVHLATCPYSLVFETPVIQEHMAVLRKYTHAPHPFVLVPPVDGRTLLPPGAAAPVELTLIGPGIRHLPHFIRGFEAMGESGRFGGRFRLRSVVSAVKRGEVVYDGASRRFLKAPPEWTPPEEAGRVERIRLEFVTPLRIRTDGRYNARPDFVAVTHALLRRVHLLRVLYGGADPDPAWMRPLLADADRARTERADWRLYEWDRMSGRQGRRVEMDGVLGRLEAAGELTELAPYFRLGEWVNVGSGTSMGLGRYRMVCR